MTSIGLITLFRQATQAAREGDANAFAQIRASIDTLDRMGEISREELDLLTIVASARLGDTEQARFVLKRFGSLSTTQQQDLFNWLGACPEMAHTRFREFVLELRVSARAPRRRFRVFHSRSLSVVLVSITILLLIGVVVLIQFILPKSAVVNTKIFCTPSVPQTRHCLWIPCQVHGARPCKNPHCVSRPPPPIQPRTKPLCKKLFVI